MAAGTVLSGGFPGRIAQEVSPNQKCNGCLHYDRQAGRVGVCTIGLRPDACGDGDMQDIGYAPISRGAGAYLGDMGNHGAHAPEVEPQHVGGLYGAGSTRPVQIHQVSLGEEHVHFVKSFIDRHSEYERTLCRLHQGHGQAYGVAPFTNAPQSCSCSGPNIRDVAKALASGLSNRLRASMDLDDLVAFVEHVAKGGNAPSYAAEMRRVGAELAKQTEEEDLDPPRPDDVEKGSRVSFRSEDDMKPLPDHPRGWVSHAHVSHGSYQLEEPGMHVGEHARLTYRSHDGRGHVTTHPSVSEAKRFARQHHAEKTGKPQQGRQASANYERHLGVEKSIKEALLEACEGIRKGEYVEDEVNKGTFYTKHGAYVTQPAGTGGRQHVLLHPRGGGHPTHVGTFEGHKEARRQILRHASKLSHGSGDATSLVQTSARQDKDSGPVSTARTQKVPVGGVTTNPSPKHIHKAIDNTKHSHVVTGRLAPEGRGYANVKQARVAVDKLDRKYGAAAHTYRPNPNFKPVATAE